MGSNRATATFAGIYAGAGAVNTTRDGISVNDGRYQVGVFASTRINPDLVGEMRVIVAPADAETGRGVGQVQILTRSGTNDFRGSAVWNVQNSALNANTWNGNRVGTAPTWYNRQQLTGSYGGPIVKNKTFFFALFDGQRMYSRQNIAVPVLTAEARRGNFRFFPGVINGNADQAPGGTGNTTIAPVVDVLGNPAQPAAATGPDHQCVWTRLSSLSVPILQTRTGNFIKMIGTTLLPPSGSAGPCPVSEKIRQRFAADTASATLAQAVGPVPWMQLLQWPRALPIPRRFHRLPTSTYPMRACRSRETNRYRRSL